MRDPNDGNDDDIDRAYRAAVAATEDGATAQRRRGAVLKAIGALDLPERRAANASRWRPSAAWWRGAVAACVIVSSGLVVMNLRDAPEVAMAPGQRWDAEPAAPAAPESAATEPAAAVAEVKATADAAVKTAPRRALAARAPATVPAPVPAPAVPAAPAAPAPSPAPATAAAGAAPMAEAADLASKPAPLLGNVARAARSSAHTPSDSLLAAAGRGDMASARQLLRTIHPDAERDPNGRTALTIAVMRSDVPLVKLLLASRADRLAADRFGQTPLGYAEASGDPNLLQAFGGP